MDYEALTSNAADVAFLQDFSPLTNERITSVPLYEEPVVLVASPAHSMTRQKSVYPEDLKHQSLLFPRSDYVQHPVLKNALQASKLKPSDNLFLESGLLLRQAVKDRRCLAFLPLSSVKSELEQHTLVQLPWAGEDISMTVYAMYDVHSMALPAIESLITFVQSMIVESQA